MMLNLLFVTVRSGSIIVFVWQLKYIHLEITHFNLRIKIMKTPEENNEEKFHSIC